MARIWHSGFELNSTTANMEWTSTVGAGSTIQTGTVRTGTYAGQITNLVSATAQGFSFSFLNSAGNGPFFIRFYINVATLPTAANRICSLNNTAGVSGTSEASILLDNTGALTLFNGITQVGSASSSLSIGTWYAVEIQFNNAGAGIGTLEARLNGSVFATASNLTFGAGILEVSLGANLLLEAQTTGNWFFDDVAINNSTGSFQNTYPGSGNIIHLPVSAAGDNNGFQNQTGGIAGSANNFTRVNEAVPPDDAVSFNGSSVLGTTDDFVMTPSPSILNSTDTVSVVAVGIRYAGTNSVNEVQWSSRIKKASGGTISSVAGNGITSTTYFTGQRGPPGVLLLVTYQDPDGSNWTKSTLDTAQAGYRITTNATNGLNVSYTWLSVDCIPSGVTLTVSPLSILGAG